MTDAFGASDDRPSNEIDSTPDATCEREGHRTVR
jgi:hypothetical protein